MNSYLANNICNFECSWIVDPNKKYDIISTCFFKINDPYKKFDVYVNGLRHWIDTLNSIETNFRFRIFIDEHIHNDKQIMDIIKSCDKIDYIVFKCSKYMKDNYHVDVFGALIRFFPLFNFDNNDTNNVIVADIDLRIILEDFLPMMKRVTTEKEILTSKLCLNAGTKKPYLLAGRLGFYNIKFDKNILLSFIENIRNVKESSKYGNRRKGLFGYGTDEIFLNHYLVTKEYMKYIKTSIVFTAFSFIYYYMRELKTPNHIAKSMRLMKFILGKYYQNQTLDQMFEYLDTHFYHVTTVTAVNNYLAKRFYKVIKALVVKDKSWFPKKIVRLIHNHFNGIVRCNVVMPFTCNYDDPSFKPIKTDILLTM